MLEGIFFMSSSKGSSGYQFMGRFLQVKGVSLLHGMNRDIMEKFIVGGKKDKLYK